VFGLPKSRLVALAVIVVAVVVTSNAGHAADQATTPDFGPNVSIFDPTMPTAAIKAAVDAIARQQIDDEMGPRRYALLFKPGTYGSAAEPLHLQLGYYMELAGLGALPTDVTINGHVDVYNRCLTPNNCLALNNFWRALSNLTINVSGLDGCRGSGNFWAVSQAAPMRRVQVTGGKLILMDYCTAGPHYASGGFIADSAVGPVTNGSQQQFLVRNSSIGEWSNGVWNQVFAGVQGAPADAFPKPPYTTLTTTPVSREKPFLSVDAALGYRVFVPAARAASSGPTWRNGPTPGRSIPLPEFFVARPSDSVSAINAALGEGKHLLFTPGVYDVDQSITVTRPNTVVLGLGIATLTARGGVVPMRVADVRGVTISGLMIDAGPVESPVLLQVGTPRADGDTNDRARNASDASDPTALHDVFFRIGGPHVGKATVSLEVNSDDVLIDHLWAWRADHGVPGSFGWNVNTADTGVIVNGDHVTVTGLFVEHYQQHNVVWNGQRGTTIFFQNELPYDPPDQDAYRREGALGWAAYKVADRVTTHDVWGAASYVFFNVNPTIHAARAFEVPTTPGVRMRHLLTVNLGAGTIDRVVNGTGDPVTSAAIGAPSNVVRYPGR
jgi:hypothetical protein